MNQCGRDDPGRARSAGAIQVAMAIDGGVGQIQQGLPCQFGYAGIGMTEQVHEHADPGKFLGENSDHGNGFSHRLLPYSSAGGVPP